ncbi:D-2-hydroxyacid dehydrogenase [Desulforhopalus singaporensis]|uniref:Glycerate dehydrogenase n=1 Tax=Desulforhopalus singaporensis TaxID=91360 RepID=A0A1H0JYD6_9BACT|nr:D-2-hydroxyacid dehydrogenase [Desulforhopalus singaporensis]SDO48706.1 glycerate dehydrogenase [Desulforhopalus singaporensis]
MKAVFLDLKSLDDIDLTKLERRCSELQLYHTTEAEEIIDRIAGAELVIVNKVRLTKSVFENAPALKLVCVVATGTDVIDLQAASDCGVAVYNCRAYGTSSVVQHVFSLLLCLQTNIIAYHRAVQQGRWQQSSGFCFLDYPISELSGKTIGILGYGTLGRAVAETAHAFGMKTVIATRPGAPPDDRPTLDEILPEVDVLSLHCPLTQQTRNIIDARALSLMKPTAILINAARGGLVDEHALLSSLRQGQIGGAGIDVLSEEPPKNSNPLLEASLPNLLVTPHIAWASREARENIIEQTAENITDFHLGKSTRRVV